MDLGVTPNWQFGMSHANEDAISDSKPDLANLIAMEEESLKVEDKAEIKASKKSGR